jgi:hypothetical protein
VTVWRFSARRLRTINQPTRPDARAAGRLVAEQTKPLRPPMAPRANEQRPHCPARKRLCRHADLELDSAVIETNEPSSFPAQCNHALARSKP